MNSTAYAFILAGGVAVLAVLASPRFRCWRTGHDMSRPWTEGNRRLEYCERCGVTRDHVYVAPTAPTLHQADIDGGVPVAAEVIERTLAVVAAETAAQAARAEWMESVKQGAAARRGEGGLTSKGVM